MNRLGVISKIVISWILSGATGVSYTGSDDPGQTPKLGVRLPESAKGECGCFEVTRKMAVQRRQIGAGLSINILR